MREWSTSSKPSKCCEHRDQPWCRRRCVFTYTLTHSYVHTRLRRRADVRKISTVYLVCVFLCCHRNSTSFATVQRWSTWAVSITMQHKARLPVPPDQQDISSRVIFCAKQTVSPSAAVFHTVCTERAVQLCDSKKKEKSLQFS